MRQGNMNLNFESPKIPLLTLAGITSLTDVLQELPLPGPHADASEYPLFAYSTVPMPGIRRLTNNTDAGNVANIIEALRQTSTDEIVLKDLSHDTDCLNGLNVPPLLQAVLAKQPDVFCKRRPFVTGIGGNIKYNSPTQATTPQSPAISSKGIPLNQASPGEGASQISSQQASDHILSVRSSTPHSTWPESRNEVSSNNEFTVENSQPAPEENPKICLKIRRKKRSTKEKSVQDSFSNGNIDPASDIRYDIISVPEKQQALSSPGPGSLKLKLSRVKTEPGTNSLQSQAFEVSTKPIETAIPNQPQSLQTQNRPRQHVPDTVNHRSNSHESNSVSSPRLPATIPSSNSGSTVMQQSILPQPYAQSLAKTNRHHKSSIQISNVDTTTHQQQHSALAQSLQPSLNTNIPRPNPMSFNQDSTCMPTTVTPNTHRARQNHRNTDGHTRTPSSKPRKKNSRHIRVKFIADQEEANLYKLSDVLYPDDSEVSSFDDLRSGMMVVAKWPQNGKMYEALVIDPLDNTGRKFRERKPPPKPFQAHPGHTNRKSYLDGMGSPMVLLEPLRLPENFDPKDQKFTLDSQFTAYQSMADRIKLKRQQRGRASGSGKKRKRSDSISDDVGRSLITLESDEDDNETFSPARKFSHKSSKKKAERRRIAEMRMLQDGGMASGSLRRFTAVLELVLEDMETLDAESLQGAIADTVPESLLIPASRLRELNSESAKLKAMGTLSQIPGKSLTRLMAILEPNIRAAIKLNPLVAKKDVTPQEQKWQQEIALERVYAATDAALTALNIMTSPGMPKAVFIEDVIEGAIQLLRFQLENTIYPEYDTVYKVHYKKKGQGPGLHAASSKQKRAHYKGTKSRAISHLYTKMISLLTLWAELLEIQPLTDTSVLQVSSVAISPFFVENVRELQLSAIHLTTAIFARYERHRKIILEDIFQSLARLPTSKRNLRNFRLNYVDDDFSDDEESTGDRVTPYIQMVSALILQMIQAIVTLPVMETKDVEKEENNNNKTEVDELRVVRSYDSALRTGQSFLAVFLKKCASKSEEIDYRPLFENFIHDLLATVNKPEWPASEMMLSILGRLLVHTFSNRQTEASLRVASIDYLGVIAAKLRRDAVSSHLDRNVIRQLIADLDKASNQELDDKPENCKTNDGEMNEEKEKGEAQNEENHDKEENSFEDRLHSVLLNYIRNNADTDAALMFALNFYVGQWLRDVTKEAAELQNTATKSRTSDLDGAAEDMKTQSNLLQGCELKKKEILKLATDAAIEQAKRSDISGINVLENESSATTPVKRKMMDASSQLTYENATLITRYLASARPFSHSFDTYLTHILRVREETAVAVRTRAIKCLAEVVAVDPSILAREDIWQGVQVSLVDGSTSVREAAVDLVGRFILLKPDLVPQYYKMLTARILDTGVSVRKRVIKILRDLCHEHPDLPQLTDACVKMIRRVNDEEGIKKLVHEVFMRMWFTPLKSKDAHSMRLKALSIADVVAANRDIGYEWIEQMMIDLIDTEIVNETVELACQQIVDCLVDHLIQIEQENKGDAQTNNLDSDLKEKNTDEPETERLENGDIQNPDTEPASDISALREKSEAVADALKGRIAQEMIAATMRTLVLFAKIRPKLLVPHVMTLQPHLTTKCENADELQTLQSVCRVLELAVPLLEHPGEAFLASLEEDLMKLILKEKFVVVKSAIACLGSVTRHITENYRLVWDCFQKLGALLNIMKTQHQQSGFSRNFNARVPQLKRTLYITGHLMKTFDFDEEVLKGSMEMCIKDKVYACVYYFTQLQGYEELRLYAVGSLGLLMIQDPNMMFRAETKECYNLLLAPQQESDALKSQVLINLQTYLSDEDARMQQASRASSHQKKEDPATMGLHARKLFEEQKHKQEESEDIKEICDVSSGMASSVMQVYLKQVLECFFHPHLKVRCAALNAVYLTLNQGLVHPLQCVPFIVAISTDPDPQIYSKAEQLLGEINKRYSGFVHAKSLQGVKMAYRLQEAITSRGEVTRGTRLSRNCEEIAAYNKACCSQIYALIRVDRKHRRSLMLGLLNLFDDTMKTDLNLLLFVADNLAYFPYVTQDEPLFVMSQIEIYVSVSGSNVLQSFKECLQKKSPKVKKGKKRHASGDGEEHSDAQQVKSSDSSSSSCESDQDISDAEDESRIINLLPNDDAPLLEFIESSMACLLLLWVKQHLKLLFGFTDNKIHRYSSSEPVKANDKQVVKKRPEQTFEPNQVCEYLKRKCLGTLPLHPSEDEEFKKMITNQYFEFNDLMTKLDPNDADSDSDKETPTKKTPKKPTVNDTAVSSPANIEEGKRSETEPVVDQQPTDQQPAVQNEEEEDSDRDSDAEMPKKATALDLIRKSGMSKFKERFKKSHQKTDRGHTRSPSKPKELRARKRVVQYVESSDSDESEFLGF